MKPMFKITALLAAAVISAASVQLPAFAESAELISAENEKNESVGLAAGAFHSGVFVMKSGTEIRQGDTIDMTVTTYIPFANNNGTVPEGAVDTAGITVSGFSSESFLCENSVPATVSFDVTGGYLKVDSFFTGLVYQGVGSVFTYKVSYTAGGEPVTASLSCSVPGCVEAGSEIEEPEDLSVPAFVLATSDVYTVKAGEKTTVRVGLRAVGSVNSPCTVSAMLSSADSSVIVEDVGAKTNSSLSPSFSFDIVVPATAAEGVYNLALDVTVFNKKGEASGSYNYSIPVKVVSDVNASALTVKSYKASKDNIRSGDSFDLTITLENNCGIDLENIEVMLSGLDSTKFVLDGGFSKQTVSIADEKTGKVTFPLVACAGISSVRESIAVQAVYGIDPAKPEAVNALETSVILTCTPEAEKQELGKYDLTMTDYKVSSSAVAENTRFTLSVTLENSGKEKIENARLTVLGLDGSRFAVNSGLTYVDFDISAGKSKTFSFEIVGCKGITSIREVIPLLIEYGSVSSEVSCTIPCKPAEEKQEDEEKTVFAPNIIIESYDFGGDFVTAGQTFPLNVVVKNASSEAVIENLKITINGASSSIDGSIAYSPANSANSFFFETLGMKATADISLDLLAKVDAVPNSYPVEIAFTYEYRAGGKHYQASPVTETITIPLQQEDRLTVNTPDYPNYAVGVGEMCYVSTSIVNKGKSGVYNVSAKIEGEGFDLSQGAYYIGNINSGSEEYYDAQLTPNIEGEIKGEIVITYEDSNGSEKEQRVPFSFTAVQYNYDAMYGDMGMMFPEDEMMGGEMMGEVPPEGGFPFVPVAIGAAVVIAVVVIVIVVVKKKKRAKELEDDDEDF